MKTASVSPAIPPSRRPGWARLVCRWVLLTGLAMLNATGARGHAVLLHAEPAAGGRVETMPAVVRIYFNEGVEPLPNSIRVVDREGKRADRGHPRSIDQGQGLEVELHPLSSGPYAVFWRVHSVDGHQVQGHFGFGFAADAPGDEAIAGLAGAATGLLPGYYFPILKGASLLGVTVWLGGLSFLLLVFAPALAQEAPPQPGTLGADSVARVLWIGAFLFLVAETLTLAGHSSMVSDLELPQAASPSALALVLSSTNYGYWWVVKMSSAAMLLLLCLFILPRTRLSAPLAGKGTLATLKSAAALALGITILFSTPLTGHARAVPELVWLAVASDGIHLAATAVWIGGLISLAVVLIPLRKAAPTAAFRKTLARRFSGLAALCVGLLFVTGAYNTWLHLPGWTAFWNTRYGQLLLLKLAILVPLLAIAAINRWRVLPNLAAGEPSRLQWASRWLGRLVRTEAALGILILGVVAVLTQQAPATAASGLSSIREKRAGNFVVSLKVTPLRIGVNQVEVAVKNVSGEMVPGLRRVTLYLNMLEMDMGLQTIQAVAAPGGSYSAHATLSMEGRWRLSVEVSPQQGDAFLTEFDVFVSSPDRSGGNP